MTAIDWEKDAGWGETEREADWDDRAYRQARRRAARRADLYEELVKYALVTGLLLLFIRPVGVIVMLVWGWKLFQRYSDLRVLPRLRRRWIDEEMRRSGARRFYDEPLDDPPVTRHRRRNRRRPRPARHPQGGSDAGDLVRALGDDPGSPENRAHARAALADLERVAAPAPALEAPAPSEPAAPAVPSEQPRVRDLEMRDVVESGLERVRGRARVLGVELLLDADTSGPMQGDVEKLHWVVIHILNAILDAFERSPVHKPRIEIALGENLAGTRVWLRIRDNSTGVDPRSIHPIVRSFYAADEPGQASAVSEFQLDFSKRNGEPAREED